MKLDIKYVIVVREICIYREVISGNICNEEFIEKKYIQKIHYILCINTANFKFLLAFLFDLL